MRKLRSEITTISIFHGPCLGTCPVYHVLLRRQGLSEYQGGRWAVFEGVYVGTIDTSGFDRLAQLLIDRGFFGWRPGSCFMVDAPVTDMDVELADGRIKRVADSPCDAPNALFDVERAIDSVAASVSWRPRQP